MAERLTRVIARLGRDPGVRLLWETKTTGHLVRGDAHVLVFAADADRLPTGIRDAAETLRASEVHVVLVGGGRETLRAFRAADLGPKLASSGVRSHLADNGEVWTEGGMFGRRWMAKALADVAGPEAPMSARSQSAPDVDHELPDLRADVDDPNHPAVAAGAEPRRITAEDIEEIREFLGRPIYVTWAIIAVSALFFAGETASGGSEWTTSLLRWGAGYPERGLTEPWRVLSSSLLHIGPIHILMNMSVLHSLGSTLERALGPARFLVLWVVACAVGGALAIGGGSIVAGASTGLWGVLVAEAVLLLRRSPLLPGLYVARTRGRAVRMLGLNLLISLLPGISLLGHLGGGIAGAALLGSGVLTRGLVPGVRPGTSTFWRGLGGLAAAALVVSGGMAVATGRPWELVGTPQVASRDILGLAAPVPAAFTTTSPEPGHVIVGEVLWDPFTLEVIRGKYTPEERTSALDAVEANFFCDTETTRTESENEVLVSRRCVRSGYTVTEWRRAGATELLSVSVLALEGAPTSWLLAARGAADALLAPPALDYQR